MPDESGTPAEPVLAEPVPVEPVQAEPTPAAPVPAATVSPWAPEAATAYPPLPDHPAPFAADPLAVSAPPAEFGPGELLEGAPEPGSSAKSRLLRRLWAKRPGWSWRWASAVAVFAVVASGTAYAVTDLPRKDVPGLGTPSDGREQYAAPSLPPLPSGSPEPKGYLQLGLGLRHAADLRALLPKPPTGATPDRTLPGAKGWVTTDAFLHGRTRTDGLADALTEDALARIAATGWTSADGSRTTVYLLQFPGAASATDALTHVTATSRPNGAASLEPDAAGAYPVLAPYRRAGAAFTTFTQPVTNGSDAVRDGYVVVGDVLVEVEMRDAHAVAAARFAQLLGLEYQLLSA